MRTAIIGLVAWVIHAGILFVMKEMFSWHWSTWPIATTLIGIVLIREVISAKRKEEKER